MKGIVSDIQHCSVHDGPGIRTTVFLKGCNLRCAWCHNPETVYPGPEILTDSAKCISCGRCTDGCFSGARVECGREVSIDELWADILLDSPYYGNDGGVTVSGGEPLLQPDFTLELLERCHREGIGRAIETNLSLDTRNLLQVCSLCEWIMCDMKTWDSGLHHRFTGAGNERIKENLAAVSTLGIPIIVRTPVIAGINDTAAEIGAIAGFLASLPNIRYYELLTYHPLGMSKGRSEHFIPQRFERPTRESMRTFGHIILRAGLPTRIDNIVYQEES